MSEDSVFRLKSGLNLGFAEYGDVKGKPVFSFHGWPSSRLHASVFSQAAKEIGVRVICPDRPGYGLSDFDSHRSLMNWPDTIIELADHLHIKTFSVLGISGGGPYAAVCAYKLGKRLQKAAIVVGLAPTYEPGVFEGMPFLSKFGWEHYGHWPWLRFFAGFFQYSLSKMSPSLGIYSRLFGAKSDKKFFVDRDVRLVFKRITQEAFRSGARGAIHDLALYSKDWGFAVRKIHTPVSLWYGQADKNVPTATAVYYANAISHAKCTIYPHEGHFIMRTHAKEILSDLIA